MAHLDLAGLGPFGHRDADGEHPVVEVGLEMFEVEPVAELHVATERAGATLDVYVCNVSGDNSRKAEALYAELLAAIKPADIMVKRVWRGKDLPITVAAAA